MLKTLYYALYLSVLGMIVTGIAYVGYNYTHEIIEQNNENKISDTIALLFDPTEGFKVNPNQSEDAYHLDEEDYPLIDDIYEVLDSNNQLYSIVYDMHVQGRNAPIHALVAIDPLTNKIVGVVYYNQAETPNLGERYTRDEEIIKLIGQNVDDIHVDAILGATVTWNALETMYQALYTHYEAEVINHE